MLNWLQLILQYFPMIIKVVAAIQEAIPNSPGEVKKAVAMVALAPSAEQEPAVSALTDKVVAAMKGKPVPGSTVL